MRSKNFLLTAVLLLAVFFIVHGAYAGGQMRRGGYMTFDSHELLGAVVRDSHGEVLGMVNSLQIDSGGHTLAIINHGSDEYYGEGGGYTPVPIETLRFSRSIHGELTIMANVDEKKLETAPAYDPTRSDRRYEADIYRYYGVFPMWSEEAKCQ